MSNEVARELTVDDPVDGVDAEDLAGNQSTLDLVHKLVIPFHDLGVAVLLLPRGLGCVQAAVLDHDPDAPEGIGDNTTLRRTDDVELLAEDEDDQTSAEHAEAEQVGGPEADVELHVRSGQERQTAEVDAEVEDHVDALDGDGGIEDNALSGGKGRNGHLAALVLIGDQRSDVGLDTTGTNTNDWRS